MPLRLTELDFRRRIIDLAAYLGYEHVGFRAAQTDHGWRTPVTGTLGKGWPDLVLVSTHRRRVLFVELKARKGVVSSDQERVLDVLRSAGAEAYVWREGDTTDEDIVDILTPRRGSVEYGSLLPPPSG